ncbi:MAG: sigma-70 family RNA polymerase sigma factor [Verrucomicrobiota bacterium]|jgi:RNA polymerase sigma factor (sigma-70 family)
MQAKSDAQLLREYAVENSEPAFGDVVHRHADLVYSAALRQAGSPDLAAEIAQSVFIDLARKAGSLAGRMRENASLAGWLYRATRYAALNLLRQERRRHARERQVMQELDSTSETSPDWNRVSPLLDEALSTLDEPERDALLLRFFKNQDFRAVGAALGVSDDTAQKRVSRSLEKLRGALARRGVTTTTVALSAALSFHAVQAAPPGLAAALISASLVGATAKGGATLTLLKLMSMTKLQLGLGAIVIGGLTATVAIQHQTARRLSAEIQAVRQQAASLAADNESLSNRLGQISAAPRLADDQFRELMRLRGEVGRLRQQTNLPGKAREESRRPQPGVETAKDQSAEEAKFDQQQNNIVAASKQIGLAFRIYANHNNDQYPTNLGQIGNELGGVTNFPGDISLDRFEMVNAGAVSARSPRAIVAREQTPRPSPHGGWERAYLLYDGSVQLANAPDGNFDSWERNNTDPVPSSSQ